MKKTLKFLMLAVVVSFAFLVSACSTPGQLDVAAQANVGSEESYTTATASEVALLQTYTESETATKVNSYKMTMDIKVNEVVMMSYNLILAQSGTNYEMAAKMTADLDQNGGMDTVYMYLKDGYFYGEMAGQKYKAPINIEEDLAEVGLEQVFAMNLDGILDLVHETSITTENLKVSTEGNITRFALMEETGTLYLIFEDGQLTQCAVNTIDGNNKISVVIETYNQAIQYPDFSDYILMPIA